MDRINAVTHKLVVQGQADSPKFSVDCAWEFKKAVTHCALRYVLDTSAAKLCTDVAILDASVVLKALDTLCSPGQQIWIEWIDRDRLTSLSQHLNVSEIEGCGRSSRVGVLIDAADDGQSGKINIFHETEDGADMSPLFIKFDLRNRISVPWDGGAIKALKVNHSIFPDISKYYNNALFQMSDRWAKYYKSVLNDEDFNKTIVDISSQAWFDWPFVAAFLVLLQSKAPIGRREINYSALNKLRLKKGKPPLIDHVEVSLNLEDRRAIEGVANSGGRSASRLHHVRGHLVSRGSKIFWRSAHLRGSASLGIISGRTVRVTNASNYFPPNEVSNINKAA